MDNFEHLPSWGHGRKSRHWLVVGHPSGGSWHIHQYQAQPHTPGLRMKAHLETVNAILLIFHYKWVSLQYYVCTEKRVMNSPSICKPSSPAKTARFGCVSGFVMLCGLWHDITLPWPYWELFNPSNNDWWLVLGSSVPRLQKNRDRTRTRPRGTGNS